MADFYLKSSIENDVTSTTTMCHVYGLLLLRSGSLYLYDDRYFQKHHSWPFKHRVNCSFPYLIIKNKKPITFPSAADLYIFLDTFYAFHGARLLLLLLLGRTSHTKTRHFPIPFPSTMSSEREWCEQKKKKKKRLFFNRICRTNSENGHGTTTVYQHGPQSVVVGSRARGMSFHSRVGIMYHKVIAYLKKKKNLIKNIFDIN